VARTPRKYTAFFTTREREEREAAGPRGNRRGRAREAAASFRHRPPFSLFHPRKLHFSCPSFSRRASILPSPSLSRSFFLPRPRRRCRRGERETGRLPREQSRTSITIAVAARRMRPPLPYTYFRRLPRSVGHNDGQLATDAPNRSRSRSGSTGTTCSPRLARSRNKQRPEEPHERSSLLHPCIPSLQHGDASTCGRCIHFFRYL